MKETWLKRISVVALSIAIASCGGVDDRKAKYMQEGLERFDEGNLEKARIGFKNVLQIDPEDIQARFQLGRVLEKLQDWRAAAGQYQSVLDLDPNHIDATVNLGKLYLLAKESARGLEKAESVLERQPDHIEALTLKGGALIQMGEYEKAREAVAHALELDPGHVDAVVVLAGIYAKTNQTNQAILATQGGIERNPKHTGLQALLAGFYLSQKKFDEAEQTLKKIIELEPTNLSHRVRYAKVLIAQRKLPEAEQILVSASTEIQDDPQAKLALVEFYARTMNDRLRAIATLEEFIQADPENADFVFAKASLYETENSFEKAKDEYRKLIGKYGIDPQGLRARVRMAVILLKEESVSAAQTFLSEVLEQNSRDNEALMLRGQIALYQNDPDSAITDFQAILRDQPENSKVIESLAKANLMRGEFSAARDNYARAVQLNPRNTETRIVLADIYAKTNALPEAKDELKRVLQIDPDNLNAMQALAKLHIATREWVAADDMINAMLDRQPESVLGFHLRGLVRHGQSRFDDSEVAYKKALALQPDGIDPLTGLVRLYLAQKKVDAAANFLAQHIEKSPNHHVAYNLKGEIELARQNSKQAAQAFEKAIELKPDWWIPYRGLAAVNLAMKDEAAAVNTYKRGIDSAQQNKKLFLDLATLQEKMGDIDDAIRTYEIVIDKTKEPVAKNNLAMLLVTHRADNPESLAKASALTDALADSNNAMFLDTIGWVRLKQGDVDSALTYIQQAHNLAPNSPSVKFHLGMVYVQKDDKAKALEMLKAAVATNQPFAGIEQAKATIKQLESRS